MYIFVYYKINMAGNSFGTLFNVTTFGESHGPALGGVIDGCPAGIVLDINAIQDELNRRKPGQSAIVTQRKEPDECKDIINTGTRTVFGMDTIFSNGSVVTDGKLGKLTGNGNIFDYELG